MCGLQRKKYISWPFIPTLVFCPLCQDMVCIFSGMLKCWTNCSCSCHCMLTHSETLSCRGSHCLNNQHEEKFYSFPHHIKEEINILLLLLLLLLFLHLLNKYFLSSSWSQSQDFLWDFSSSSCRGLSLLVYFITKLKVHNKHAAVAVGWNSFGCTNLDSMCQLYCSIVIRILLH